MAASSVDRLGAVPRRPLLYVAGALAGLIVLLALGTYFYAHSGRDVIAKGVRIDGIAVGGLHGAAARKKVERELTGRLNRPVTVRSGGRSWTLGTREAQLKIGTANMVSQALAASREGSIVTRAARGLFGGSVNKNVDLVVSYSHPAVRALAAKVRAAVNRPPRDATVQPVGSGLHAVPGQTGLSVDYSALGASIDRS